MLKSSRVTKPSLITQIQLHKNYYQHRRRINKVQLRRYSVIKKSISFDYLKQNLHEQFKNRYQQTKRFKQSQISRTIGQKNSKMLMRIFEYNQKVSPFRRNTINPEDELLHHNSRMLNNKKVEKICEQNKQIHFRITKAKSLYSKSNLQIHRYSQSSSKLQLSRMKLKESINIKYKHLNTQYTQIRRQNQQVTNIQTVSHSETEAFAKSQTFRRKPSYQLFSPISYCLKMEMSQSRFKDKSCRRVRNQNLAAKLYDKKLKLQRNVISKMKFTIN